MLEELIATFRRTGLELWTFDGPQDIHSAAGRLGIRAQAMVGAFEVERTGERVREMRRQKARSGFFVGPTPYGFTSQARLRRELEATYGPDRLQEAFDDARQRIPLPGRLVIDPAEAEVVREIFDAYVGERVGCRGIALRLNRRGLRTRDGARWSAQQILHIVRDPKSAGLVHFDEAAYDAHQPACAPVHRQEVYEGRHEGIVTREAWEEACRIRESRDTGTWRQRSGARLFPLVGVATCAQGHPVRSKSGSHYCCRERFTRGPDPAAGGCSAPLFKATTAEAAVRAVLSKLLGHPGQLHGYLEALARQTSRPVPESGDTTRAIQARIEKVERSRARYFEMLEEADAGSADERVAKERLRALQDELDGLRARQQARRANNVVVLPTRVSIEAVETRRQPGPLPGGRAHRLPGAAPDARHRARPAH